MKKNIVLIDLDLILIKSIHASENVNIEYLIVEANDNKIDELKSLYGIKNILSIINYYKKKGLVISYKSNNKNLGFGVNFYKVVKPGFLGLQELCNYNLYLKTLFLFCSMNKL